jgi:hypothetical protein
MFIFLPILVLVLCGVIALYAPVACFNKRVCKLKFLRHCRPKRSDKKDFASSIVYLVKWTFYIGFAVFSASLVCIGYLTTFSIIFVLTYIVLLPLFYFYSAFVLVRKVIIWREVRGAANPSTLKKNIELPP